MIAVMDRDAATQFALITEVKKMMVATKYAAAGYGAQLDRTKDAMGPEFAARYDSGLQAKVEATMRAAANRRSPILK